MSEFEQLHPSLQYHVVNTLGWSTLRPTQLAAIAPIHAGTHCLLLAPTAGGKTEAAAIPVLSRMLVEAWPATSVLYVCPIKALLNNLEPRLSHYAGLVGRRVEVWHGDIPQSRKNRALKDAPDILLTTPESVEAMLISARVDRPAWFGNLQAVIVDELHAFAGDDRGWHLRSVLHRLDQYLERPLQRIGLSATVSNPSELLAWLAPNGSRSVVGSASVSTDADVTIDHVGSLENAATVIARLHRGEKRLVFCDSRSSAEQLSSMLRTHEIRTFVSHASLSLSERRQAEAAFSEERNCVIVATSTLELGIDVGDLDRVVQIDSPSSVSSFLQRMGRTGRRTGGRRNCLFLTTNDNAFLLALGVTQKWSNAWVEAAVPPAEPWHIVAQQAMVLILERGELATRELVQLLRGSFPELPIADFEVLVEHMVGQQFLDRAEGVVRVGPQTERSYARGHYRDLLASFSGSQLLTGRHGAAEVGYIDPTILTGERNERLLLLAGRSWRVTDVDWSKRIVWLEPAAAGGKARWMGGARGLGRDVCQGICSVLADGASPTVTLSRRARAALQALADEIPVSSGTHFVMSRSDGAPMQTWTFAGTRANRTLARQASIGSTKVRFDALSVQAPVAALPAALPEHIDLTGDELAAFHESIKFADCVPRQLLSRTIVARNFEMTSGPSGNAVCRQDGSAVPWACRPKGRYPRLRDRHLFLKTRAAEDKPTARLESMEIGKTLQPPDWIDSGAVITGGLDLLGLRLPVQFIGGTLLDGVTTVTPSVRYLAFRAWLIHRYGQTGGADSWQAFTDFAARIESALVLGNLVNEPSLNGLIGSEQALERLAKSEPRVQISSLVKSPASTIYTGPSDQLGISKTRDNAVPGLVFERGLPLAQSVNQRLERIPIVARLILQEDLAEVSVDDLRELGAAVRIDRIPDDERDLLLAAIVPAAPLPKERARIGTYASLLALASKLKAQPNESNFFDTVCSVERFGEPLIDQVADGWATYCVRDAIAVTQEGVLAAVMGEILGQPDGGLAGADRDAVIAALMERVEEHDSALRDMAIISSDESVTDLTFRGLEDRLRSRLSAAGGTTAGILRWPNRLIEPLLYRRALKSGAAALSLAVVAWIMAAIRVGDAVRENVPEYGGLSYQGWRRLGMRDVVLPELERFRREDRPLREVAAELAFRTVQQHLQITWSRLQVDLRRDVALLTAEGNKWFTRGKGFVAGRTASRIQQALGWLIQLKLIDQKGMTADGEVVLKRAYTVLAAGTAT